MKIASMMLMALMSVASSAALAQYTGPSTGKSVLPGALKGTPAAVTATNVKALAALKDDARVSLQGKIVRHLGGDNYRFADSSGEIDVEIDTEHWPANTPIDDKTEVRISGEYDKGLISKPKVEVERIEKIK